MRKLRPFRAEGSHKVLTERSAPIRCLGGDASVRSSTIVLEHPTLFIGSNHETEHAIRH